ncbi:hypothetical protein C8F01DRAFT_58658 [Mycena amicta]|nr:hypothetical protein C8F01DRAFT_58658 [Mycena amicta]
MVNLSLCSSKGNHVRYFPYNGYLGLTALKVDGVVRTRLDGDLKLLPAHSITVSVRCYEARVGLLGVLTSNCLVDYTQILWSQTDPDETIGDLELPFRITIPPNVAGFSTASYASVYKCSWRVEAIVNHPPMLGVGSRLIKHSELPLVRFDVPRLFSLSTSKTPPDPALSEDIISHPHLPPIRYAVDSPNSAIGPLDLLTLSIQLLPSAPVTFRSASLIVERRLSMKELSRGATASPNASPIVPTSHPSWSLPIPQRTTSSSSPSPASSYQETSSPLSSTVTLQPPDSRSTASLLVNSIAAAESSGHFSLSDSGVWRQTLTLQWPAAKSHSRWSIGESIESDLVSVRFFARLKLVVSSSHGTESVELKERELLVVSTNEAERQLALSKY